MTSKLKLKIIGPAGRHCLKRSSPFATLLLDIATGLRSEDVANLKLVIQADKLAGRREVCKLNYGADVLAFLDSRELISSTCTDFLEHLLIQIGRKDLEIIVRKYHEDRYKRSQNDDKENTERKQKHDFTQLRDLKSSNDQLKAEMKLLSIQTAVKEVYDSSERSKPDGSSGISGLCETVISSLCKDTDQTLAMSSLCKDHDQTLTSSPMSVDSSQENCTDEQKIGHIGDKVWLFENDAIMSSQ